MRVDDGPPPSTVEPPRSKAPESEGVHSSGSDHTIRTAAAFLGVDPNTLRKQCSEAPAAGVAKDAEILAELAK
jgi:hypothetical protein